jgi:hypothetical protein
MKAAHVTFAVALVCYGTSSALAQETKPKPEDTEVYSPVPPVVTPGRAPTAPPSDAIVLFDGHDLEQWVSVSDHSPAHWIVSGGVLMVNKAAGNIETKRSFTNYQLHLEWRIPKGITGTGQARGNSGVFLASTGAGDAGYEIQVLDSYENKTYVNGQAAAIYKQYPPLANAMRPPGEWQTYDIVWTAPTFRHRVPERCAGAESRRAHGRDGLHRRALVPQAWTGADQAAGARRSQRTDQLPQHLGARARPEVIRHRRLR